MIKCVCGEDHSTPETYACGCGKVSGITKLSDIRRDIKIDKATTEHHGVWFCERYTRTDTGRVVAHDHLWPDGSVSSMMPTPIEIKAVIA